jgi:transcriptional regulator NrdR family protein
MPRQRASIGAGLRCPVCMSTNHQVMKTQQRDGRVVRCRRSRKCQSKCVTVEQSLTPIRVLRALGGR